LKLIAALVDRRFDEANDPILAMIQGDGQNASAKKVPDTLPADFAGWDEEMNNPNQPDTLWNRLVDCERETKSSTERAEALRVLATWEELRAETFAKLYREAVTRPVKSPQCKTLDQLSEIVHAAAKKHETISDDQFQSMVHNLGACAEDSERLNGNREQPEALKARKLMFVWGMALYNSLVNQYNEAFTGKDAKRKAAENEWRSALANPSSLVFIPTDSNLTGQEIGKISEHNRSLCDQVITVAGLTPNGLALYVPPAGQQFMAKNAKDYPRMCLVQDESSFIPGVPRYLLVWAYSEGAFTGFQPVRQVTTSPVSGTGTLRNFYGDVWNFTYTGTMTEIDTLEAPYVLQSRSLFLNAYDQNGNVISQHSITTSSQAGGDSSYAAGYNAGALISLLWNNPSHLIRSVLKDVQKDSTKYGRN
jgi:hypothetical protein